MNGKVTAATLALMLGTVCFANSIPNAGFELGSVGWNLKTTRPRMSDWTCAKPTFPTEGAWRGRSFRVEVPADGSSVTLASELIKVEPGKTYRLSARMKASTPGKASLTLIGPTVQNWWNTSTKGVMVGTDWTLVEGTVTVAEGHHECLLHICWSQPGAFWVDDVVVAEETTSVRQQEGTTSVRQQEGTTSVRQQEPATACCRTLVVSPCALESGFVLPDTYVMAGRHAVTFRAIDYERSGSRTFLLTARHPATGWKQTCEVTLELERGVAAEKEVEFDFGWYGEIELTTSVRQQGGTTSVEKQGGVLSRLAVLQPIEKPMPKLGDEFSVGVKGTQVFPPLGTWSQKYQGLDRSFAEHLRLFRACGVQHIATYESELGHAPIVNPAPGVWDFSTADPFVDALVAAGIPISYGYDASVFSYRDPARKPPHWSTARRSAWYLAKNADHTKIRTVDRNFELHPKPLEWADHIAGLVRHFRGRIFWYEPLSEPNLRFSSPELMVDYLRIFTEQVRANDPDARVAGISTTQDYGCEGAGFAGACFAAGAAQWMDAFSFHPYAGALDNGIESQEGFIAKLRDYAKKGHAEHLPLWNTECFYLLNRTDYPLWRRRDPQFLRPQNLVRRTLVDLGEGLLVSNSIDADQLFRPHFDEITQFYGSLSGRKLVPTDAAVGLNAYAALMTGAKAIRSLKDELPDGLRGYLFTLADGRPCAVLWAFEDVRKFIVRTGVDARDMYGNMRSTRSWFGLVRDETDHLVDERPVYFIGEDDPDALLKELAIRPEKPVIVNGVRRLDAKTVSVELVNMRDEPTEVRCRLVETTSVQQQEPAKACCRTLVVTLPAKERRAVRMAVPEGADEKLAVVCEAAGQTDTFVCEVRPTVVSARSGETIRVGAMTCTVTLAAEGVVIDAKTADATRVLGSDAEPWAGDSIEFFIDPHPDTDLVSSRDTPGTFHLCMTPPSDDSASAPGHKARQLRTLTRGIDLAKFKYRLDADEKGFGLHLVMPWSALGLEGPQDIGFDTIVTDRTATDPAASADASWSRQGALFSSRFKWGRITK